MNCVSNLNFEDHRDESFLIQLICSVSLRDLNILSICISIQIPACPSYTLAGCKELFEKYRLVNHWDCLRHTSSMQYT